MELVLIIGLFGLLVVGLTCLYNNYTSKVKYIECKRSELVKEYNYRKHVEKDLLHANMIGSIIDTLDSKNSLKNKLQFIREI